MTEITYTKLHGAENDFLLSWGSSAGVTRLNEKDLPEAARRMCARTTGVGGDGWMLVWREEGGLRTRLFNSDGSEAEISGNGTR
jgi:diaminopimelate epimerase